MTDVYGQMGRKGGESRPKVRFDAPGARHRLYVQTPRSFTFPGDNEPTLIVDVLNEAGAELSLICGSMGLHNAIVEAAPAPGAWIDVTRGADVPMPNGTAHTYTVEIVGAAQPAQPAQAPAAPAPAAPVQEYPQQPVPQAPGAPAPAPPAAYPPAAPAPVAPPAQQYPPQPGAPAPAPAPVAPLV